MNLSFSIKHWSDKNWNEIFSMASELKYKGIEIANFQNTVLEEKGGPFHQHKMAATARALADFGLSIPCMDAECNIADIDSLEEIVSTVKFAVQSAKSLKIPYIRVHAKDCDNAIENTVKVIEAILPIAEKENKTILIETSGVFVDSKKLREVLKEFSSDSLGALWIMDWTYTENNEYPEKTIENLGAFVKHVHLKDFEKTADGTQLCLIGEGDMPVDSMMNALRSINYDGFISLEWKPKWLPEIDDMELILSHFENFMSRFKSPSKQKAVLYNNKTETGKFVWKKDLLVEKTFSQVLDTMVEQFPDQLAFKYTTLDYTRTYSEFRDDVDEFAKTLISLGVKAGSHVAVWASNIPQWYIAFWATVKLGAVLVTVNTAYKIHEAEYLLRQSDTHTLIMIEGYRDSNYSEIIKELCPELETLKAGEPLRCKRLPFLRNVITVSFKQKGCLTWEESLLRANTVSQEKLNRMAAAVDFNDVCNMQYTSGTTGFPKGVMLTHYNIVNNGKCIGDRMDLSTADRMMIHVPMFHCFGMALAMTASMTHGATLMPLPYFSPKSSLACINMERITAFHGVPTMFIAMLEHPDFEKTDFSYMRTGIMAGSPCPVSVMQDVVDKMNMKEITIVYGQTESSPGCTMSSTDDSLDVRVNTVGRALPEIECKIVDPETGEDLPDNVTGEFVARGYNIMKGYYKMPKATESAIDKNGWLHTGDLACRTPEGNYRITGRLKDMIIRGGENIYPKEIEEFIYTHPKVKDVQVIGVPDEQYGEEIMACIILKDGETMTEAEMKEYVLTHMAKHKVPRYVDFVDSFPMNVAGKILKYQMREDAVKKLGLQKASEIVTA